ncbi:hypothetical protein FOC1_g10004037 [Fusarium oxysporum f. sp. cubense race 1]|uniref:F-box domain-containing protein n=1 Tax=Fusarium oxysporum f. sp. cubense (strain race 1) TaxID=1229664 RepID=N4UNW6_FUSC1|nr:hypothetical protein FOC1_g10004037 [Fusarium oxysporum f. sp. cubense race 1]
MKFDFYRDVLSLMMVMQDRRRASSCKLLQLPTEILADIVDLLAGDRASLESLALVNSDCQQLARCCQFAEVNFDYSLVAKQLASQLVEDKSSQLSKPGIGACIRRVTFASHPHHVAHTHRELSESFYGDDAQSFAVEQRQVLSDEAREKYVVARAAAVEAISSLPNLETLSWRDQFSLDKSFFERITRCSAQHIDLNRPAIDDAWSLTPPLTPSAWPLSFFSTLFHLCSPTLESLTWTYIDLDRDDGVLVSIGKSAVSFPRLRYLRLQIVELDSVAISSFLAAPLKRIAKFISQHTGLCRLYLHETSLALGGIPYLDEVILPILISSDFGNLRSLYLAWGEAQIPEKSLRRIGRLVSLEQLNHDKLRHHLSPLQGLTNLALVCDTYPVPVPGLPSGFYYEFRIPGPEAREDAKARPELDVDEDTGEWVDMMQIWERVHRNRMLDQAEQYAAVFPKLEWMFCGQRPMGFIKTPEGQCELRRAVPLTQGRDECRTYRQAMFRGSN